MTIQFCPQCGNKNVQPLGTVFIEDGPWDGKRYANEGDYARYQCRDCAAVFGAMPAPVQEVE